MKNKIVLKGSKGIEIHVPVSHAKMSAAEKAAYSKFSKNGKLTGLTSEERELLKNQKTYLTGAGVPEGFVCRFDWSCWAV